jgi:hypothetical protein
VLIEAKDELEHGQFIDWVVRELRFGTRKDESRPADLRKAQILMFLARNDVISNPCHWHDFPPSPRTLWELTQIRPKQRLLELIAIGASGYQKTGGGPGQSNGSQSAVGCSPSCCRH